MSGNDSGETTASEPPAEDNSAETHAARAGGRGAQPHAASLETITSKAGLPRRVAPITTEEWIARHLATAPRISDERWARIDAVFAVMEDQQRSASARPSRPEPE